MLIDRVAAVYKKMSHAAMRAGRSPEDVRLVAVTKTVESAVIREALDIGLRSFGENRVQEAHKKILDLETSPSNTHAVWHLIGHLQKNKAKQAVDIFDLIHTVDSVGLAEELGRQAAKRGKVQNVLIQVKLSEEETKHGIPEAEVLPLIEAVQKIGALQVKGLMTMPPYLDNPEEVRPYFRRLRELRDRTEKAGYHLPELSMGMSHDFEIAISEGATLVRVGEALFGERKKPVAETNAYS